MKTIKTILAALAITFTVTSCNFNDPSLYEEEIIDVVKYNIAMFDYGSSQLESLNEYINNSDMGAIYSTLGIDPSQTVGEEMATIDDILTSLYLDEDITYNEALVRVSTDSNEEYYEECTTILDNYNSLRVTLSEFKVVSDGSTQKSWSFNEIRTGVEFLFTIEYGEQDDLWYVEPMDDSVERYLISK